MSESNPHNELFSKLRGIREAKGLPLDVIARESRIHMKYLLALENGQLSGLTAVYDQLFFRSYLKALGVEEQEYLEAFLKLRGLPREQDPVPVLKPPERKMNWGVIPNYKNLLKSKNLYVLMPFVVVIIILIFLLSSTRSVDTEISEPVKEIDIQSIAASLEPLVKTDTLDTVPVKEKKLNLLITGLRTTWFRLVTDKQDTSEFTLRRGNQMEVKARTTFELVIGRADGLQFRLNDKSPQLVSPDSLVVSYLLIDSTGIVVKRIKQPKPVLQTDSTHAVL